MHRKLNIILLAGVVAAVGCRREGIRVYTAPKDPPPTAVARSNPHEGHTHGDEPEETPRPRPQFSWKLPNGWREGTPGRMSVATFTIASGDQEAEVTVTPLGKLEGRESMIVNMFREQFGLAPLSAEESAKELKDVAVGNETGKLFELAGTAGSNGPARILTVMAHRSDASWFYKLSGPPALVEAQKPAFIEFLKSIQIKETAATTAVAANTAQSAGQKWQVPEGWQQIAPGQMQLAKFSVPGVSDATAQVSVSKFDSDTGGTLANVNRWRGQVGLAPIGDADLPGATQPFDPKVPGSLLINLTNGGQQLIGAIVPREGQYWFYKLLGGAQAVAPQRENFIRFVQSAH